MNPCGPVEIDKGLGELDKICNVNINAVTKVLVGGLVKIMWDMHIL